MEEAVARASGLAATYGARASAYDALLVRQRAVANRLELFVAVAMCLVGASGSAGFFSRVSGLGQLYADSGLAYAAWDAAELLFMAAAALATAYLGVVRPRDKMQAYGSASDTCSAVASVAKIVEYAGSVPRDGQEAVAALSGTVHSMLTTLEATAADNQPPLDDCAKKTG